LISKRINQRGYYRALATLLFIGMSATILVALFMQYVGGYIPCKLCLAERTPYYGGIVLMAIVFLGIRLPILFLRLLFVTLCALMLYNVGLSVYHAGAEWQFWPGPTDCTTAAAVVIDNAASLLDNLNAARPASCSEASFVFLGLSLAGWNALISLLLALISAFAAFSKK